MSKAPTREGSIPASIEKRDGAQSGKVAVGVLEHHPFTAQPIEVRRHRGAAVPGQHLGLELIRLDEEDVRPVVGHAILRSRDQGGDRSPPSRIGYWNTRQVSATTNARVKPTIRLSNSRLALISAMSVSYRATDFAASRALVSSAPALRRAS